MEQLSPLMQPLERCRITSCHFIMRRSSLKVCRMKCHRGVLRGTTWSFGVSSAAVLKRNSRTSFIEGESVHSYSRMMNNPVFPYTDIFCLPLFTFLRPNVRREHLHFCVIYLPLLQFPLIFFSQWHPKR